jgi:acyl transferase domain-containing protein
MQPAIRETDRPPFRIVVQNVCGWVEVGPAIAAIRAGASGIVNLEGASTYAVCVEAIAQATRLAGQAPGDLGFRFDSDAPWTEDAIACLPERTALIVLTASDATRLAELRAAVADRLHAEVLVEVTSSPQAHAALAAHIDGLIAKGHESGGFVGEESTFVLLQRLLALKSKPVLACGGIGLHSAAACYAAGAAGIVLDSQLLLTPESALPRWVRTMLTRMSGDETVCVGGSLGCLCRIYKRPGTAAADALTAVENDLADVSKSEAMLRWSPEVRSRLGWSSVEGNAVPLGQDAVLARPLADRFVNVAGIIGAIRHSVREHVSAAQKQRALSPGAPLAQAHGTEYPILQGPMTRVSDTAPFAKAVAENGGLPFLALALLRGPQCRTLLEETAAQAGNRAWGVGILGFVPAELRAEQLAVVSEFRPPFAIIAGGRPDQARHLEELGIGTYIHVPAPSLLGMYLEDGARKFIFEGRECGGHVGPRTSFVLWDTMVEELLESIAGGVKAEELHIIFAGGIHDERSSAMVAALAAPLVAAGAKIGVLMGTAYLFTTEAVSSGAIVDGFQQEAIKCSSTVILESGPGHSTRCVDTAFSKAFRQTRRELIAQNKTVEEIRDALENLNLGRLRIASKGIARLSGAGEPPAYAPVSAKKQHREGMYMIGQVAALRHQVLSIRELHEQVSAGATAYLDAVQLPGRVPASVPAAKPCDIAIVGMGCLLPKAPDSEAFWANIIGKVDGITEIPGDRFNIGLYFDEDRKARDKVYSRWGGFIEDVAFDPMRYGIPPNALSSIDPVQLLMLVAVEQGLRDAGYDRRSFSRDRASVIFGFSGGLGELGVNYALRSNLGQFAQVPQELMDRLPEWTEDSFAGLLPNVATGRVANRLDLTGVNFTVDAACASSLAAIYVAARELATGSSDLVISGGVDSGQNPFGYLCFSKAQAISPRGRCSTFDEQADGIAISEGISVVVLKRLADAERDGDRIYAVIKGIAGSSDGRGRSMTAPKLEGQMLALKRSYAQAGVPPSTVGLIEAHGTGTVAGDGTEIAALTELFQADGAMPRSCAVGSVKSMIGHTKAAAGVTGLMKAALALHHRVLPPTLHVEQPNAMLREPNTPFFTAAEAQPWLSNGPRRAGVSSFGFGGTNFHAVLEEYTGAVTDPAERAVSREWPSELFVWAAASTQALAAQLEAAEEAVSGSDARLAEMAAAICGAAELKKDGVLRLAIVANSRESLLDRIADTRRSLADGTKGAAGVYLASSQTSNPIAFLFPGQGSQSPGMLRDLAVHFAEFRNALALADSVLDSRYGRRFSSFIYPPTVFSAEEKQQQMRAITDTVVAQPALGVVDIAACALLNRFGVRPDMVAGHSYGEYVALCAAGVFSEDALLRVSEERGRAIRESLNGDAGAMAAVAADAVKAKAALAGCDGVTIANYNSPRQTIIAGPTPAVDSAMAKAEAAGLPVRRLPVACAFHTPLMEGAASRLADYLSTQAFDQPRIPVFSNTLAAEYPPDPAAIRELLTEHLTSPVRFADEIEAMYARGARVFVEAGPKAVLTGLARTILEGRDAQFIQIDSSDRDGLSQFLHALAQLWVAGVRLETAELFRGRVSGPVTLADIAARRSQRSGWMLNPARVYRDGQKPAPAPPLVVVRADAPSVSQSYSQPMSIPALAPAPVPAQDNGFVSSDMNSSSDAVVLQFQQLMSQFLETQAAVMTMYLGGGVPATIAQAPTPIEFAQTSAVAIPAAPPVQVAAPVAAAAPVAVTPSTTAPVASIQERLLAVVGERTGYPADLLSLDAGIEADLGIDSIKRVEILGTFRQSFSEGEQTAIRGVMDSLTAAKTLREMIDRLNAALAKDLNAVSQSTAVERVATPARDVEADLLAIVSLRTGYPLDMLNLDAAIEADLGIDSIKRVEIIGEFRRQLSEPEQVRVREATDTLTSARTLRVMIGTLSATLNGTADQSPQSTVPTAVQAPMFRLTAVPVGKRQSAPRFHAGRVTVITEDETGLAAGIASALQANGERPVLLRHSPDLTITAEGVVATDLADVAAVEAAVAKIRADLGPIGAILHFLPMRAVQPWTELDADAWRTQIRLDVTSLYALAKAAEADLRRLGRAQGAAVVAVTGRGAHFGFDPDRTVQPSHYGVADFVKTLALEFEDVACKVVDVDPTDSSAILHAKLLDELTAQDDTLQVGLPGDQRLSVKPQVLRKGTGPASEAVTRDWVFVLTGGARGITAAVAKAIASRYQPAMVLIGSSSLPRSAEPADTAGITDAAAIRSALLARLRTEHGNRPIKPVEVEAAYARLMKNREILRTISELREAGARVEYQALDVRDHAAFTAAIDGIYARYHRLDVFIHGAGVIEDKLLRDKTADSFDRVLHTKADSSFVLARSLRMKDLKRLIFMSSITAALGNRGQADYAAANGIMNGIAVSLAGEHSGRIISFNWGPWDQAGMVSNTVREQFLSRGVQLITIEDGAGYVLAAIESFAPESPLVVVGDGPWAKAALPAAEQVLHSRTVRSGA